MKGKKSLNFVGIEGALRLGGNSSSSGRLQIARCYLGFCRRGGPVDRSDAAERDEYDSRGGVMIWSGRRGMAGAAWMASWDFLQQVNLRSFDRMGKALSKRLPIPQNLTAKTEIIPNPDTAPKFFNHPPILATKST